MIYRLTTPHMHDEGVKAFQKVLQRKGFYTGPITGGYDEQTAQAVWHAKYQLGYPKPDKVAGDMLYGILTGQRRRNPVMVLLAKKRVVTVTPGYRILSQAVSQLGQTEHPAGSNRSKFSEWYGLIGPWCAMFCTWCAVQSGSTAFKKGSHWSYVPTILSLARLNQQGLSITHNPKSGDFPCYDWPGESPGTPDHIGVYAEEQDLLVLCHSQLIAAVTKYGKLAKGEFWAIEGNTSEGNDSNGGEVMLRKRHLTNVLGFVHVNH